MHQFYEYAEDEQGMLHYAAFSEPSQDRVQECAGFRGFEAACGANVELVMRRTLMVCLGCVAKKMQSDA